MNKVELVFNKAETRLAGFPYGRDVREGAKTKSTDTLYDYK